MSADLKATRGHLERLADELEGIQLEMRGIESLLPESPAEAFHLMDVETMDSSTEIRAVIACIRNDYIGPAIRDIRGVLAETEDKP